MELQTRLVTGIKLHGTTVVLFDRFWLLARPLSLDPEGATCRTELNKAGVTSHARTWEHEDDAAFTQVMLRKRTMMPIGSSIQL